MRSTTSPSAACPSMRAIAVSRTHGCRPKNGRTLRGFSQTCATPMPAAVSRTATSLTEDSGDSDTAGGGAKGEGEESSHCRLNLCRRHRPARARSQAEPGTEALGLPRVVAFRTARPARGRSLNRNRRRPAPHVGLMRRNAIRLGLRGDRRRPHHHRGLAAATPAAASARCDHRLTGFAPVARVAAAARIALVACVALRPAAEALEQAHISEPAALATDGAACQKHQSRQGQKPLHGGHLR